MKNGAKSYMPPLKTVKYTQHDFHGDPESRETNLLAFVYDIPYFSACGVFPPYHIVNQIFSSSGSIGGMSPGATWEPFTVSCAEYDELIAALENTPVAKLQPYARYADVPMKAHRSFDHIQDRIQWMTAVCRTHRDSRHNELKKLQKP